MGRRKKRVKNSSKGRRVPKKLQDHISVFCELLILPFIVKEAFQIQDIGLLPGPGMKDSVLSYRSKVIFPASLVIREK